MYTFRVIEELRENEFDPFDQVVTDYELGLSYSKIRKGTKLFDLTMKSDYPELGNDPRTIMILRGENGRSFFIQKNTELQEFTYYIVGDTGSTLQRVF